ncbi:hypothetical protein [Fibrobacter sp.]|uniref:hypothetical protein n=1 Tax=Fibrobacter sp. TaxID=35828 RepID=UPI00388DFCF9
MLATISFACQEYGWSLDYVLNDVSLLALMLLMRQKLHVESNGKDGFSLSEQEQLDGMAGTPWDELVRRNREMLRKQFKNT